jgi:bacterioferritin-associated ferredoxin
MIVCCCNVVSDREIRRAVLDGASTLRELARSCRAGTGCGGCRPALKALLDDARRDAAAVPPEPLHVSELGLAAS